MNDNFLRGFVFAQAGVVFFITLCIIVRYSMKVAVTHKKDRAKPWHIILIGLSYLWATLLICMVMSERWNTPLTYVAYNGAGIFILGDIALLLMLSHLFVQRNMMDQIRDHVADEAIEEKRNLAAELKKQTSGLAQMIRNAGQKADNAYHEANDVNLKISGFNEEVSGKLTDIKENAETARLKAEEVSEKADVIGTTGDDTNTRVRKMEGSGNP